MPESARHIQDVAQELGISIKHCYRERASICRRVAQFICELEDVPVLQYLRELDEFRFHLDRAAREVSVGNADGSLRLYDALLSTVSSVEQQVEACCRKADTALSVGKVKLAEAAFARARTHAASHAVSEGGSTSLLTEAWLDITGAKLAYFRGDSQQAIALMERATANLEIVQTAGSEYAKALFAETLGEAGAALWNVGDRERGYELRRSRRRSRPNVAGRVFAGARLHNRAPLEVP